MFKKNVFPKKPDRTTRTGGPVFLKIQFFPEPDRTGPREKKFSRNRTGPDLEKKKFTRNRTGPDRVKKKSAGPRTGPANWKLVPTPALKFVLIGHFWHAWQILSRNFFNSTPNLGNLGLKALKKKLVLSFQLSYYGIYTHVAQFNEMIYTKKKKIQTGHVLPSR